MSQSKSLVVRTIPRPTRAEILALYDQGLGTQAVATRLQISLSWARKVKQDRREQGKTANATTRRRQPTWAPLVPRIQAAIAAKLLLLPQLGGCCLLRSHPQGFSRTT